MEVIFIYFLGEVDLELSIIFFKNVWDFDDDMGGFVDDSFSFDDEDIFVGGFVLML